MNADNRGSRLDRERIWQRYRESLSSTFNFASFDGKITANSRGCAVPRFSFSHQQWEILTLVSDKKDYKMLQTLALRNGTKEPMNAFADFERNANAFRGSKERHKLASVPGVPAALTFREYPASQAVQLLPLVFAPDRFHPLFNALPKKR